MMMGLVMSLPPICRLPKLYQVLARKGKSPTDNYYEVKGSFHKKNEALDKFIWEGKWKCRKSCGRENCPLIF